MNPAVTVRPFDKATDTDAVGAIDRSFRTDEAMQVSRTDDGFELTEVPSKRLTKVFPLDLDQQTDHGRWDAAWVAETNDGGSPATVVGFAAARFSRWNHRVELYHLYVDAAHRGKGIARALLDHIDEDPLIREQGHCVWLETSHLNVPGIRAYRALGFELCGLDLELYCDPPSGPREIALFFARPLPWHTEQP
ncbi:Acetyltransferase (GNAT) family protein [Actinopolymorpha cephalotaxi]|uniref:Acetyltransferase (GNAT) family protein n=1 Tax=Actinopolymorpha cephalotaxi TaxID=504797 RepID=A0A1I2K455_9ACTN|nr:GNAT family N-acetyltransferase [Actinopolymorpha cephalotaxi]NYH85944.1 ribosomal protein S18 acetylase RimI-like enzyme [Actinopolymorpha cephalotaxi]SFF61985.1 Acetyltransferase (GNAT) family protein [Actinopolymorpha cephalotaxi]